VKCKKFDGGNELDLSVSTRNPWQDEVWLEGSNIKMIGCEGRAVRNLEITEFISINHIFIHIYIRRTMRIQHHFPLKTSVSKRNQHPILASEERAQGSPEPRGPETGA
jgi:hypothetical protein